MYVVFGATGRTGRRVVDFLLAAGVATRAVGRCDIRARPLVAAGAEFVRADLANPDDVCRALVGARRAFFPSVLDAPVLRYVAHLLAGALGSGVERIVNLSAMGASPAPKAGALQWHAAADRLVEESGIPYTNLRPCFYMQNLLRAWRAEADIIEVLNPVRAASMAMIDLQDVAAVAARAMLDDGFERHSIELTGPRSVSFGDVVRIANESMDSQCVVEQPCRWQEFECHLNAISEIPENVTDEVDRLYQSICDGLYDRTTQGVAGVLSRPPRDIAEFIRSEFIPEILRATASPARKGALLQ